ncbi:MAG: extracellular solute-binding protein, partial [Clostridiales bacterium]|nr:extracellular solute-binding protein [Clostridiales bacterium]
AVTMIATSMFQAGCSKKPPQQGGTGTALDTAVSEDSPWFTVDQLDFNTCFDPDEYDNDMDVRLLGADEDGIYLQLEGYPASSDGSSSIYANNLKTSIVKYGYDGELVYTFDLIEALDENFPETVSPYRYIDTVSFERGAISVSLSVTDDDTFELNEYTVILDPGTLQFGELLESTDSMIMNANIYGSLESDGYYVQCRTNWDMMSQAHSMVRITDPDGTVTDVSPADFLPDASSAECVSVFLLEGHNVLVRLSYCDTVFAVLDLDSKTMSPYTGDTSVFGNPEELNGGYVEGIGNLMISDNSIDLIDIENGTRERYFDYNCCNINRNIAGYMSVEYMTPEKMVLSVYTMHTNSYTYDINNLKIFILQKQDTNPNAGKQIIRVAAPSGVTFAVAESICAFNDRSDTHFMIIDERYDPDYIADQDQPNGQGMSDPVYNRLAIDLFAGDGPDIIFDVSGYSQLCDDRYLMDLSDIALPDDVFGNVIDSARTGDKLYNIPLLFYPDGIVVNSDTVSDGQNGFTFDQYEAFVDDVCNGTDPTGLTRLDFFMACVRLMGSESDYNDEAFWQAAEFARDRYNEPVAAGDETQMGWDLGFASADEDAYYMTIGSFRDLLDGCAGNIRGKTLMGMPSADGRGPNIVIASSVSVSAGTANAEACREFVELLMSSEVQNTFCYIDGNPISRSALEHQMTEMIESYNEYRESMLRWMNESSLESMGVSAVALDRDECIAIYEGMIDSCRGVAGADSEECMVISEEMGAYFAGQKTPEEISELITDRIETIRNERR